MNDRQKRRQNSFAKRFTIPSGKSFIRDPCAGISKTLTATEETVG